MLPMKSARLFLAAGLMLTSIASMGELQRVPATTLRLPAAPPTFGYAISNAFPGLTFAAPVALVTPPGETNRLFVVEQGGRIQVITNLAQPNKTLFADLTGRVQTGGEQGLLGLAFHPGYATNRQFFVFYTASNPRRDRLSRFLVSTSNPNQADTSSEVVFIDQPDDASNHNGGDLHFGPDGYLYISLGDEGGANDQYNNSQTITKDFFAGILRIDVDKRPGNRTPNPHPASSSNYLVPQDNPFVGATSFNGVTVNPAQVRTEFYAVGMRNPWRMSFDPLTGHLYVGDVGQGAREEINVVTRGGNYGWAYREGTIAGPKAASAPAGFTHINPIQDYGRSPSGATNVGISVTGGVVYRGNRIPALYGYYVFADYGSGNVWALRYTETNTIPMAYLTNDRDIAGFGYDPSNGDILTADLGGTIGRLVINQRGASLPPTLADTGLFSDVASMTPNPGVVPYAVNTPQWGNGAEIERWFSLPNTNSRITFRPTNFWTFPSSGVWVQHFELPNGASGSIPVETRVLIRNVNSVYGLSYAWTSPTNAVLVGDNGMEREIQLSEGAPRLWKHPSRNSCVDCHSFRGGYILGFNTAQLNRDFEHGGSTTNQIQALFNANYFNGPVSNHFTLRALVAITNTTASLEQRVRSYFQANCAHCHLPHPLFGQWDGRIYTPFSSARIVNGPLNNNFGDSNNRVIAPGSLDDSMIYLRMFNLDNFHMPPHDAWTRDETALSALREWITNDLPNYKTLAEWQTEHFGTETNMATALADPDNDRAPNLLEYLTGTDPNADSEAWNISITETPGGLQLQFPRIANRLFEVQFKDDLTSTNLWQALPVPENRPFVSATNGLATVPLSSTNDPSRYYRVRVYEP